MRRAAIPPGQCRKANRPVYHHGVDPVTAFVLAGGKSSRMGPNQDKALFKIRERTLLQHALGLAKASVGNTPGNIWIVGSSEKFAGFGPVVEDFYPGQGPLAGIHAALSASATDLNLIIAVDMPFLQPEFLSYLIRQARDSSAAVVVPRTAKGLQPLAAVYRREFAAVAERACERDRTRLRCRSPRFRPASSNLKSWKERFFRRIVSQSEHRARVAGSAAEANSPMIKSIYH